jgi:phosphatidylglycerophosphate synthase
VIVTGSEPAAAYEAAGPLQLAGTGAAGSTGPGATVTATATVPIPAQAGPGRRTATAPAGGLAADLAALGFDRVLHARDAAELAALLAAERAERIAVLDAAFVGHRHALRLALVDPRFPAGAVPGAVAVAGAPAREALLAAALDLAAGGPAGHGRPLPDALADALHGGGVAVQRPELGTLVATVPGTEAELATARAAVAAVDEEAVRLRRAVKARDGFFTTFCVSPYSRYLARWCARRGLTPNQVTTASLVTALAAAASAATATRLGFVGAGLLLLFSFVLDCTDGQLARYSLQYSTVGAWLDATFDRAKEYSFYAGLAIAAGRTGDHVWALALAAMVLMTFRHSVDFAFMAADQETARNPATAGSKVQAAGSWCCRSASAGP